MVRAGIVEDYGKVYYGPSKQSSHAQPQPAHESSSVATRNRGIVEDYGKVYYGPAHHADTLTISHEAQKRYAESVSGKHTLIDKTAGPVLGGPQKLGGGTVDAELLKAHVDAEYYVKKNAVGIEGNASATYFTGGYSHPIGKNSSAEMRVDLANVQGSAGVELRKGGVEGKASVEADLGKVSAGATTHVGSVEASGEVSGTIGIGAGFDVAVEPGHIKFSAHAAFLVGLGGSIDIHW
jgi:hypothetical protein